jgi:hypothetical protein
MADGKQSSGELAHGQLDVALTVEQAIDCELSSSEAQFQAA